MQAGGERGVVIREERHSYETSGKKHRIESGKLARTQVTVALRVTNNTA